VRVRVPMVTQGVPPAVLIAGKGHLGALELLIDCTAKSTPNARKGDTFPTMWKETLKSVCAATELSGTQQIQDPESMPLPDGLLVGAMGFFFVALLLYIGQWITACGQKSAGDMPSATAYV
jgi:protein-S-isoprenylcysteine O-methyltransferase Ste14